VHSGAVLQAKNERGDERDQEDDCEHDQDLDPQRRCLRLGTVGSA
jgi:hypothetical protein